MSPSTHVEVLSAVFQVGSPCADAADPPASDASPADAALRVRLRRTEYGWQLPGGPIDADESLSDTARRYLVEQAQVGAVRHLEQLSVFSDPDRVPGARTIASTYLGLVPSDAGAEPTAAGVLAGGEVDDTAAAWHDVDRLPPLAYDHDRIIAAARHRLAAKLSYTNIAFALAPAVFPMSELSAIYGAALGYQVDSTNLLRVLSRRSVVVATGTVGRTGRTGGRPPALYSFADDRLVVTDEFATLRPPL
ncbi:MAG: NUDIX domain-containing protein [Gordonia sp. (in: high G+C Gram-positive bacteria)]